MANAAVRRRMVEMGMGEGRVGGSGLIALLAKVARSVISAGQTVLGEGRRLRDGLRLQKSAAAVA